jgi:hypothetical protein
MALTFAGLNDFRPIEPKASVANLNDESIAHLFLQMLAALLRIQ